MRKIKLFFYLLFVVLVGILFYQNWEYFKLTQSLKLNLYAAGVYQTPMIPNWFLFALCFVGGLILSFFVSLVARFRFKKNIKQLNATIDNHLKTIEELKNKIVHLQEAPMPPNPAVENSQTQSDVTVPS